MGLTKLFSFETQLGEHGVGTQNDIDTICKESNTTVVNQELASYDDTEWSVCCGCNLAEGMYMLSEGVIQASDDGIELISKLIVV